jgi:hypothetical protein
MPGVMPLPMRHPNMRGRLALRFTRGKTVICCVLTLFVASCGEVARYYDLTRAKPELSEIIGVWVPDKATREYMRDKGRYDTNLETKLILEESGEVKIVNMPDWWRNGFGESYGKMQSEQGRWELHQSSGSKFWEIRMALSSGTKFLNLLGQKQPYKMFLYVGDPDSGEVMTFTRSPTSD